MTTSPNQPAATWQDPNLAASARLDALIAEMSLPEKLAQLGSVWLGFDVVTGDPGRLSPTGPLNVPPPNGLLEVLGADASAVTWCTAREPVSLPSIMSMANRSLTISPSSQHLHKFSTT
jgi:hypothetical protein